MERSSSKHTPDLHRLFPPMLELFFPQQNRTKMWRKWSQSFGDLSSPHNETRRRKETRNLGKQPNKRTIYGILILLTVQFQNMIKFIDSISKYGDVNWLSLERKVENCIKIATQTSNNNQCWVGILIPVFSSEKKRL